MKVDTHSDWGLKLIGDCYLAGGDKIYTNKSTMNLWVQLFYCHQPDSILPQINFKLATQTEYHHVVSKSWLLFSQIAQVSILVEQRLYLIWHLSTVLYHQLKC